MIFTIFLFIEYFFYKNVYTKEISAERKLEDVINKNEKDKLQNEINSGHIEKIAKKEISESNDNNNDVIEKFNNLNTNIGLSNFNNNFNNNLNTNTNLELSNFNNNLNTNIEFSNFNKDINNLNTNVNEFTQDRRKFGFADNYDIVNEINKKNLDFNKTYDPKINFTNSINSNINKDINSDNIIEGFNNNIDNFFMI